MSADEVRSKLIGIINELIQCQPGFAGLRRAVQAVEKAQLPLSDVTHYYNAATAGAFIAFQGAANAIWREFVAFPTNDDFAVTVVGDGVDVGWRRVIAPQLNGFMVVLNHAIWGEITHKDHRDVMDAISNTPKT